MNYKNIIAGTGLLLFTIHDVNALSLSEYKSLVRGDSLQSKQTGEEKEAAKLESRSADLIFTPSLFANAQVMKDKSLPNPPIFTYDEFDSNQYSIGVQQQLSFGLQTKLSYQINTTNYTNSPLSATNNLNFVDAKPVLELSLPIWKNGFGRSARAQEEALRYQSEAQQELSEWVYSEKELKKAQDRNQNLAKVEVTRMYWTPRWSETEESKLFFPILVKRTWNKEREEELKKKGRQVSLFHDEGFKHEDPWDYYVVLTNFPLNLPTTNNVDKSNEKMKNWSIQEVFEHHQKRGNAENFIREEKYGYDLKHFPCLKLNANHAYGLLAMVAHNILRWVALMTKPDKPHFSKKLRKHFIFIPAKIVYHARTYTIKMMQRHHEGVQWLRETMGLKSERIPQLKTSSA